MSEDGSEKSKELEIKTPRTFRIRKEVGRYGYETGRVSVEVLTEEPKRSGTSAGAGSSIGKPPPLDVVLYHLASAYQGVVVGKAVANRSTNRIEVQVRPMTRRLSLTGTHSDLIRALIQKYYPMLGSPREHSAVIFCLDHLGNRREVYVQESNFQERLDDGGSKSRERDYYDSMRHSAVGRFWKTPILFCMLDGKTASSESKNGDALKQLQLALVQFEQSVAAVALTE